MNIDIKDYVEKFDQHKDLEKGFQLFEEVNMNLIMEFNREMKQIFNGYEDQETKNFIATCYISFFASCLAMIASSVSVSDDESNRRFVENLLDSIRDEVKQLRKKE